MKTTAKELDDKDKRIIKLVVRRIGYRNMTRIVHLSTNGIKHRIKVMKDYYGCSTLQDLIAHLQDNNLV